VNVNAMSTEQAIKTVQPTPGNVTECHHVTRSGLHGLYHGVCVYYCRTFYKAVRVGNAVHSEKKSFTKTFESTCAYTIYTNVFTAQIDNVAVVKNSPNCICAKKRAIYYSTKKLLISKLLQPCTDSLSLTYRVLKVQPRTRTGS
jgi:hypothetical protein